MFSLGSTRKCIQNREELRPRGWSLTTSRATIFPSAILDEKEEETIERNQFWKPSLAAFWWRPRPFKRFSKHLYFNSQFGVLRNTKHETNRIVQTFCFDFSNQKEISVSWECLKRGDGDISINWHSHSIEDSTSAHDWRRRFHISTRLA